MEEKDIAIKITGLKKRYRLGVIGGGTLKGDIQSWWARKRGKDDPNLVIGSKTYEKNETFLALDGIDLTVSKGERLGIIGHNGAGKSTLLKILSRVTAPTEGRICIDGRISSMLEVGTGFNPELTGRENIYLNGAILGMTKTEIDGKLPDIIEFSEVGEFIDTPVKRYSSGMYVKLAFSVAAHLDSEILIMDEVLAVGDQDFQKKCLKKMKEAAQVEGRTVLYVSHNMDTIRRLCSRCIVIDEGKLVFDGDVDQAISVYTGIKEDLKGAFRFTEEFRPYGRFSHLFSIETLKIIGRDIPEYTEGECVQLQIGCRAAERLKDVRFRLELWYQDGSKVGSMLSNPISDVVPGDGTYLLEADLEGLTAGQYSADLIAYTADESSAESILEGVYPALVFDLRESPGADHHVRWNHLYWGHVRLRDVKLTKEEAL